MIKKIFNGLLFVVALVLVINEGDWFPIPNIIGLVILLIYAALFDREDEAEPPIIVGRVISPYRRGSSKFREEQHHGKD